MKTILSILILSTLAIYSSGAMSKCTVYGNVPMNDPCNQAQKKPKQNSFDESNTPNSRMSAADIERDRQRELDRLTILDMERRVEEDKRAERAAIVRQQQERQQEVYLRQQEIAARNRQAAAIESAAASAEAARIAAIAAQNAAMDSAQNQRQAPASAPRTMHCNMSNGWCD